MKIRGMEINLHNLAFTVIAVLSLYLVYLSQLDAAFFCQNYCEAKFNTDQFIYTTGECKCGSSPHSFSNINVSEIFNSSKTCE
jgi:hypothetical protein